MTKRIIYVDVDDTLVRTSSGKRIPMPRTIEHVKKLEKTGAILYCWSSGGTRYARETATELGIADVFSGFLPKPTEIIDDQLVNEWHNLVETHPNEL